MGVLICLTMTLFINNPMTQLLVVLGTGILCLSMALWLGVQRSGFHQPTAAMTRTKMPATLGRTVLLPRPLLLHVTSVVQHGRIVEIKGNTEPGTIVMINGQPAATIFGGNEFRHFLGPLPPGTSIVSITCQNDTGGFHTEQLALTLE